MISLLFPAGLLALTALVLPILIHLVRRSERKLVAFAALAWISERSQPRQQVRLHERLLLALRLLLLSLLALLLAQPVWQDADSPAVNVIAVVPGVNPEQARAALTQPQARMIWLSPGFPSLASRPLIDPEPADVSSLMRELDSALPASAKITFAVPDQLAGLDADALKLDHAVEWKIVPSLVSSTADSGVPQQAVTVSIRHADAGSDELPVVRAVLAAWQASGLPVVADEANPSTPVAAQTRVLIWLAGALDEPARAFVRAGGSAIVTRAAEPIGADTENLLAELGSERSMGLQPTNTPVARMKHLGKGRVLVFDHPLTVAGNPGLREPEFPAKLASVLLTSDIAPDRALALAVTPSLSGRTPHEPGLPLSPWLACLAALLFFFERSLATATRRGAE